MLSIIIGLRSVYEIQALHQSLPLWGRWHGEAVTDEGVIYLFSYHLAEVILFAKLYVCSKKCIIPRQKAGDWFVMLFTGNITIPSGFGQ